jgi:hypothetical protein
LFYPLGDTRLRPFVLVGVGVTDVHFIDRSSRLWREALV